MSEEFALEMRSKFGQLVTAIEETGIAGNDSYELANQVDKACLTSADTEEIQRIACELVAVELQTREALELE